MKRIFITGTTGNEKYFIEQISERRKREQLRWEENKMIKCHLENGIRRCKQKLVLCSSITSDNAIFVFNFKLSSVIEWTHWSKIKFKMIMLLIIWQTHHSEKKKWNKICLLQKTRKKYEGIGNKIFLMLKNVTKRATGYLWRKDYE